MSADNGDYDRRKPIAPHCYRVVQLGVNIGATDARAVSDRATGEVTRRGRRFSASTLFEPKVGGGGHLLLLQDGDANPWARVLVEPDGPMVNLVAAILEGDWEASDDTLAAEVLSWMRQLHGSLAAALDAPQTGPPPESVSSTHVRER
jgi:hypothetical protein